MIQFRAGEWNVRMSRGKYVSISAYREIVRYVEGNSTMSYLSVTELLCRQLARSF